MTSKVRPVSEGFIKEPANAHSNYAYDPKRQIRRKGISEGPHWHHSTRKTLSEFFLPLVALV